VSQVKCEGVHLLALLLDGPYGGGKIESTQESRKVTLGRSLRNTNRLVQ